MPNTHQIHAGIIANIWHWLEDRLGPSQDDLIHLSADDLREMSSDLGISESDLRQAACSAHDSTVEMEEMMRQRGLDPEKVRRAMPFLTRDIEVTCMRCPSKAQCRRELIAGRAVETCHQYCGNAETFDELLAPG